MKLFKVLIILMILLNLQACKKEEDYVSDRVQEIKDSDSNDNSSPIHTPLLPLNKD